MPQTWLVRITGLEIVSYQKGSQRFTVPPGEDTMVQLSDAAYELQSLSGSSYELPEADVFQYVENRALKIVEGDWP